MIYEDNNSSNIDIDTNNNLENLENKTTIGEE